VGEELGRKGNVFVSSSVANLNHLAFFKFLVVIQYYLGFVLPACLESKSVDWEGPKRGFIRNWNLRVGKKVRGGHDGWMVYISRDKRRLDSTSSYNTSSLSNKNARKIPPNTAKL
jgi:hypothetical protein